MCVLGSKQEEKMFRGKVRGVYYRTDEQFKKIGAEISFTPGKIFYPTTDSLFISPGDTIFFHASKNESGEWIMDEIVKVFKPEVKNSTFRTRQVARLTEAVG